MVTARYTATYDPDKTQIRLNSTFITGYSEGSMISIEKNEDNTLPLVGVDGNVHYANNLDGTAIATITLASTSPSLPYIRELAKNKEEFVFTLTDLNDNGESVSSDQCRIIKTPNYNRNKEVEDIEVEIFIPFYE